MHKSPVSYHNSFTAIEIYICMTSMMMLDITIEVSVNIGLPLKGRTQAWLGHFLGTSGTSLFGYIFGIFIQKLWETLLFWTLLKDRNNKLVKCLIWFIDNCIDVVW